MNLLPYGLLLADLLAVQAGLLIVPAACAQTSPAPFACYFPAEQLPELPGGGGTRRIVQAVHQRISYPPAALRDNVEGRLFLTFLVTPAGGLRDIRVVKSLRPDCDAAAVRAVRRLPRFVPRPARYGNIRYTLPVTFRIAGSRRRIGPPSRRETTQAARRAMLGRNSTP